jgi:hypothetical protein
VPSGRAPSDDRSHFHNGIKEILTCPVLIRVYTSPAEKGDMKKWTKRDIAINRFKEIDVTAPRQVVVSDFSHYGALIALDKAVQELGDVIGVVHHSDRGCQYCCHDYLEYLGSVFMVPSMTDENHCYQNAVAERVNGILKDELNLDAAFPSFAIAQYAARKAVQVYNTKRTHWRLKLQTSESVFSQAALAGGRSRQAGSGLLFFLCSSISAVPPWIKLSFQVSPACFQR